MIGLIIIASYAIMVVICGVILHNVDNGFSMEKLNDDKSSTFNVFVLYSLFWPFSLIGYSTHGLINFPGKRRERQAARREDRRREELADEAHRTALASERAKQAEAKEREFKAFGLSSDPR